MVAEGNLFAFVRPDSGRPDVFIGKKTVERLALAHGDRIAFNIRADDLGRERWATDVARVPDGEWP
jgi:cold shock CspA family protein